MRCGALCAAGVWHECCAAACSSCAVATEQAAARVGAVAGGSLASCNVHPAFAASTRALLVCLCAKLLSAVCGYSVSPSGMYGCVFEPLHGCGTSPSLLQAIAAVLSDGRLALLAAVEDDLWEESLEEQLEEQPWAGCAPRGCLCPGAAALPRAPSPAASAVVADLK